MLTPTMHYIDLRRPPRLDRAGSIHPCGRRRRRIWFWFAAIACAASSAIASAQAPPPTAAEASANEVGATGAGEPSGEANQSRPAPETMGGMPEDPRGEEYTSPLKTLGIELGGGSYMLSLASGLIYLIAVYPLQALFGSSKIEPVMLWTLLPIIGPWMAQYEDSVKNKPVWRGVLIADAALQASGLVLGLIGAALSGTRAPASQYATGFEWRLGVAGHGAIGLTVSVRTL
jgi:hypothetical protein